MRQLRIKGVAGAAGRFAVSDFKLIALGDGRHALVLDDGQVLDFDFDEDGISDIWEQDKVSAMDILSGAGDNDGDGILDREEYILDFDPTTPDAPFAASIIWNSGNSVDVDFNSKTTRNYLIQFTSDLTTSEWMTLNYEVGTDGVFNFNDDPHGSTRGFYKVQVFLP
jgi:hypothetical protein